MHWLSPFIRSASGGPAHPIEKFYLFLFNK
jgi:hypothetical protein